MSRRMTHLTNRSFLEGCRQIQASWETAIFNYEQARQKELRTLAK